MLMLSRYRTMVFIAFFLVPHICITGSARGAAVFDPETNGLAAWEEDGRVWIADRSQQYKLEIPAPYWTYKSPVQIKKEVEAAPGGCVPGRSIPDSLLLVIQNKDAPTTGASLEIMPHRFRLRNEDDLFNYLEREESARAEQMRGTGDLTHSDTERRDHLWVHTSYYTLVENKEEIQVILANFLVRPRDRDVMIYRLQAFAPSEWFHLLEEDFAAIINSFRYTGETAEEFFMPEASEEELPFADGDPPSAGRERWSGGISGFVLTLGAVVVVYIMIKRKGKPE